MTLSEADALQTLRTHLGIDDDGPLPEFIQVLLNPSPTQVGREQETDTTPPEESQQVQSLFDPTVFPSRIFRSTQVAFEECSKAARKVGFVLCSRLTKDSPYGHFYCKKGGRTTPERPTAKTQCPFIIRLVPVTKQGSEVCVKHCILEHNHELLPERYNHTTLPVTIQNRLVSLWLAGSSFFTIKSVLRGETQHVYTTKQLKSVIYPLIDRKQYKSQVQELKDFAQERGDRCDVLLETIAEKTYCSAVFLMTNTQHREILQYGDVLLIDGTVVPSSLHWSMIPITVLSANKELLICGFVFTSTVSKHILTWFFRRLLNLPGIAVAFKTLITDDDNAFSSSFRSACDEKHLNIPHLLCSKHKATNMFRHLANSHRGSDLSIREQQILTICYSRSRSKCDAAVSAICSSQDSFGRYFEANIVPDIHRFAPAHTKSVLTLGVTTTSLAESANQMLKHDLAVRQTRLVELYKHMINVTDFHRATVEERKVLAFHNPLSFEYAHGIRVMPEIRKMLLASMDAVQFFEVQPSNGHRYVVKHSTGKETTCSLADCDCMKAVSHGVPCAHQFALCAHLKVPVPLNLLLPRWIVDMDLAEDQPALLSNPSNAEGNSHTQPIHTQTTASFRYREIMHEAKVLASVASRNTEKTRGVLEQLKSMTEGCFTSDILQQDSGAGEVHDLADASGRQAGRPSGSQLLGNQQVIRPQRRRNKCRNCGQEGHNSATCPEPKRTTATSVSWMSQSSEASRTEQITDE